VSFQSLKPEMQERYKALAVLLEDTAAPLPMVQTLWNVSEAEAQRLSRLLVHEWRPIQKTPDYAVPCMGITGSGLPFARPHGMETTIILDHTGFLKGDFDHLSAGWKEHYWERLSKYLG
jgi:hypothetical protein